MALLLLAGLQVIPNELYEAASVDGSTRWQQFWQITLPLLKGPFVIALLFRALDAIRIFDLFYVFGQRTVQTMATLRQLQDVRRHPRDFAPGVAAAVIVFAFGSLISIILVPLRRSNT